MLKVLKTFYRFLWIKPKTTLVFFVLVVVSPLVYSVLPYFYKLFIDAINSSEYEKLMGLLILYVLLNFADRILSALAYLVGDMATFDAGIISRVSVFEKIHQLDFAYHANKSSGSLISTIKRGDNAFWEIHHAIHFNIIPASINFLVMMFFFCCYC